MVVAQRLGAEPQLEAVALVFPSWNGLYRIPARKIGPSPASMLYVVLGGGGSRAPRCPAYHAQVNRTVSRIC